VSARQNQIKCCIIVNCMYLILAQGSWRKAHGVIVLHTAYGHGTRRLCFTIDKKVMMYNIFQMTKTTGIIIDKKDDFLKIEIDGESCSSCGNHNECSLAQAQNSHIVETSLFEDAEKGDRVELEIESKKIFLLSVLFYLLPAVLIVAFALIGYYVFKSEFVAGIMGLTGVLISLVIIYVIDKSKKNSFKHKIKRVLK